MKYESAICIQIIYEFYFRISSTIHCHLSCSLQRKLDIDTTIIPKNRYELLIYGNNKLSIYSLVFRIIMVLDLKLLLSLA